MVSKKDTVPALKCYERNKVLCESKGDLLQMGGLGKAPVRRGHFNRKLKEEKVLTVQRTGRVLGKGPKNKVLRQARPGVPRQHLLHLEGSHLHSFPGRAQPFSAELPVPLCTYCWDTCLFIIVCLKVGLPV